MLCIRSSYLTISTSRKLPEIPGRIIPQMLAAPAMRINHQVSGVSAGEVSDTHTAIAVPRMRLKKVPTFHFLTSLSTYQQDTRTRPKKKLHVATGWL